MGKLGDVDAVSDLVLPVAVVTCDDGVARAVEVDVTPDGVVVRGTCTVIDMVSLVVLFEAPVDVVSSAA